MGLFHLAELFGMTIRESANDGSDFTNPSADYRRLFLGEDGLLHVKDSSGTVTSPYTGGGSVATDAIWDAKGDLALGTGADTAARLAAGSNGQLPIYDSSQSTGMRKTFGLYMSRRVLGTDANSNVTHNVNNTAYIATGFSTFYHDWDQFPATHFLISAFAGSSEAAQTIKVQLTQGASPTDPISSGGDDLTLTNSVGNASSGWVAVSDSLSGILYMGLAFKGSNGTVDLLFRWVDVAFKIA